MNLLKKIAAAVLLLSFVVFVAFFGRLPALRYVLNNDTTGTYLSNNLRRTPIGFLNRLICSILPAGLWKLDTALTGGRLAPAFRRLGSYLMNENHPIVLVRE